MSCNIVPTPNFEGSLKTLAKRYRSMKADFGKFVKDLALDPCQGTDLGGGLRKIRMAISSKGKGKSAGARVITYNVLTKEQDGNVYLLEIYDKSEASTVKMNVIKEMAMDLNRQNV